MYENELRPKELHNSVLEECFARPPIILIEYLIVASDDYSSLSTHEGFRFWFEPLMANDGVWITDH